MLTKLKNHVNRVRVAHGAPKVGIAPAVICGVCDLLAVFGCWVFVKLFGWSFRKPQPVWHGSEPALDVAYLYPFPLQEAVPGGEMSFLKGTLSGLQEQGARCEVFSGCPLPTEHYPVHVIPSPRKYFLFRESLCLSYNFRFVWTVWKQLRNRKPKILYQRHGRFVFVGVMLSRLLRVPLFLEYQNSELWRAQNWDPARFLFLLKDCEELSLKGTATGVVLSEVLRQELLAWGMDDDNIVLTPAAVDPKKFQPGAEAEQVRREFGFQPEHVVMGFVGSFSYWHGIPVIEGAVRRLLSTDEGRRANSRLRFLLVGDGILRQQLKESLQEAGCSDFVTFTGAIPHDRVRGVLDASDVLLSPHVPLQGGQRFFGSPSKLFEYMAMGKAIIASDLEQLLASAEPYPHCVVDTSRRRCRACRCHGGFSRRSRTAKDSRQQRSRCGPGAAHVAAQCPEANGTGRSLAGTSNASEQERRLAGDRNVCRTALTATDSE